MKLPSGFVSLTGDLEAQICHMRFHIFPNDRISPEVPLRSLARGAGCGYAVFLLSVRKRQTLVSAMLTALSVYNISMEGTQDRTGGITATCGCAIAIGVSQYSLVSLKTA